MMLLALYEVFAWALLYSFFCRATHTSRANTRRDVRWAFALAGAVALVAALAPAWGHEPERMEVALLGAFAVVQLVTAHHWRAGVPKAFQVPPFRPDPLPAPPAEPLP